MMTSVVESWIESPLKRFVEDAEVDLALLMHPSGQVLAQHGFARSMDVMSACALAAGIYATSAELGRMLEGRPFRGIHQVGTERQLFLAEAHSPRGAYIFVTVFGAESSLGLVRLYFDELVVRISEAAPPEGPAPEPALTEHFERDLNRNLAVLFGRA